MKIRQAIKELQLHNPLQSAGMSPAFRWNNEKRLEARALSGRTSTETSAADRGLPHVSGNVALTSCLPSPLDRAAEEKELCSGPTGSINHLSFPNVINHISTDALK